MNPRNTYIEEIIKLKQKYEDVGNESDLRKFLKSQSNGYIYPLLAEMRKKDEKEQELEKELKFQNDLFKAESFDRYDFM